MTRRTPPRSLVRRIATLGILVLITGCTDDEGPSDADGPNTASTVESTSTTRGGTGPADEATDVEVVYRTDLGSSGNRVVDGSGSLLEAAPVDIQLGFEPRWVLGAASDDGIVWFVVAADGSAQLVGTDGQVTPTSSIGPGEQPRLVRRNGELRLVTAVDPASDLPNAVAVRDGDIEVSLSGATDRYPHGALGDPFEAGSILIRRLPPDGSTSSMEMEITLDATVVEGLSAMLIDVKPGGEPEILVTESNADTGAQLVVYDMDGLRLAESEPIGQGNRWRHQIAAGPLGPNGEFEVVDVRTPHIGGIVQFHRLEGDRLVPVATIEGFTSHVIGTIDLDLAVVADADSDGRLDLVIPTQDRSRLGVLARTDTGVDLVGLVEISSTMTTNLGVVERADGTLAFAVGTADGRLRVWG